MSGHVRHRRPEDVPDLVAALGAQQPTSRYPFRWPLPYPVQDFIVRSDELAAWTAVLDERAVGHLSLRRVMAADADGNFGVAENAAAWSTALGRPAEQLACVSAFFVGPSAQGSGLGRMLLQQAVDWAGHADMGLCLDTIVPGSRALELYQRYGWRLVGSFRPPWLPADHPPGVALVLPATARTR